MLEITNLECVRGNRTIFRDVRFAVRAGDCVRVTGANGSGKTTLLRMLCGFLPPTAGSICWHGMDIHKLREEYFSNITYIGHRQGVKEEFTALENLRVSSGLSGVEISKAAAVEALQRMGLSGSEHIPARFLSAGQRRRLALARLLVCRTPLWLLDEVLTSLDSAAVESIELLIDEHLARGGMAIVATHQELRLAVNPVQRIELAA